MPLNVQFKLLKNRPLLAIFLVAVISRILLGLYIGFTPGLDYASIADNIISQKTYSIDGLHPTALRTPLYPLVLAFLEAVSGNKTTSFIIFASILGGFNACLCAYLARRIFDHRAGIIAAALYMFMPYLSQKEVTSENGLLAFWLLAGLCLFWKARLDKKLLSVGFSGACLGLSYLVRPTTGAIPLFLAAVILMDKTISANLSRRFAVSGLILSTFFLITLPWGLRNKAAFDKWYFGQTNFWYNFYIGNHPRTFELYPRASLDNLIRTTRVNLPKADDFQQEEWFRAQAMSNIRNSGLKEFSFNCLRKLGLLWHVRLVPYTAQAPNKPYKPGALDIRRDPLKEMAFSLPYIFLLILTLIGCWIRRTRKKLLVFLFGFLFFFSLPYMTTFSYSRYATPAYFILILMATQAIAPYTPTRSNDGG